VTWNLVQRDAVRESYWRRGTATCPSCGRPAFVREVVSGGTDRRTLVAGCFACKERCEIPPSSDPISFVFRKWVSEETAQLLEAVGPRPTCPVDGSLLEIRTVPLSGLRAIRCGRCGNRVEEPGKRARKRTNRPAGQ
jgi:transcription elongation factor Elf1